MSNLISRTSLINEVIAAKEAFRRGHSKTEMHDLMCDNVVSWVEGAPAVDAAPVVHGEWLFKEEGLEDWLECSVCGHADFHWERYNFCPRCGADTRDSGNES